MRLATVFHPGVFLAEEMEARGWTAADVAAAMGGGTHKERCVDELTGMAICGDILLPDEDNSTLGEEFAGKLGKAFGTSAELWLNLERAWLEGAAERVRFYEPTPDGER